MSANDPKRTRPWISSAFGTMAERRARHHDLRLSFHRGLGVTWLNLGQQFLDMGDRVVDVTLNMIAPAHADTVHLYAAGSLKSALTDVSKAYQTENANKIEAKYGPSGLLKNEIVAGAKADVFASANMEHPQALYDEKKSGPVIRFARNKLCVTPGLKVDSANLLEHMLDPNVKLGTSTPTADPSGDYAFEVFAKAETMKPGARTALESKALQLTGGVNSATPPAGRTVYGWHVAEGRADVFLTYCTNAR